MTLRDYQQATLDQVAASYAKGSNRLLVKKPTGTGKTVTFAAMPKHPGYAALLGSCTRGAQMLVIAHREELLDQAQDKIQRSNPGIMVSIEQADRFANRYADIIIASIQTLAARKFSRLKRLLELHDFRLVIVDEAHHAAAPTYRTALVHLGFLPPADASESGEIEAADWDDVKDMEHALEGWDAQADKGRLLVGFTATPNRTDAIGLGCVFQSIAYSYALKQAIDDRWLVPIVPWAVETDTSLDAVRRTHGDFNQRDLAEAVNQEARNLRAVAAWQEKAEGRSTLAFTVDVAHAHAVAEAFEAAGVPARAISGETPKDDRREILRSYTEGRIELLSNCMVLTEGVDLPRTSCILHLKPTQSATLYEQMTGRGLRLFDGKTDCLVIDVVDISRRHSLQTAPVLYGLPPGLLAKGEDLAQLQAGIEELLEAANGFNLDRALEGQRLTLAQLQALAKTFDIWRIPELGDLAQFLSMNWIKTGDDRYRLQYPWQDGTEVLTVEPDLLGHFEIVQTFRPHGGPTGPRPVPRQRTLAASLPAVLAALEQAETFIRTQRGTVHRLKDREAPWRNKPASAKQLELLGKWRIPHDPRKLTCGAASDLIDLAKSRRAR